jgi:hypothetical protein
VVLLFDLFHLKATRHTYKNLRRLQVSQLHYLNWYIRLKWTKELQSLQTVK